MAETISRRVIDSLLPRGSVWTVKTGGNFDKYLDGMAADLEYARERALSVAKTRSPKKTPLLTEMEIDFGVLPNTDISEADRRSVLSAVKSTPRMETGSAAEMESVLRSAGYDVRVYQNDPPVDPETIPYYSGNEFLVNGNIFWVQRRKYIVTASDDWSSVNPDDEGATDYIATAGQYDGMLRIPYVYRLPLNPDRWKYIFWVCGSMTNAEFFQDWNMERHGIESWVANGDAVISKTLRHKATGIRSLSVVANSTLSDPVGPCASQELASAAEGERNVSVTVWSDAGRKAALAVCDKDGTWDIAGMITSANGAAGEVLTYTALNGVSAVRLYLTDGSGSVAEGDEAAFDNLIMDGVTFTPALIPEAHRLNFRKLILRMKPMCSWAGIIAIYGMNGQIYEDESGEYLYEDESGSRMVEE